VEGCLASMREALGSIPSSTNKIKYNSSVEGSDKRMKNNRCDVFAYLSYLSRETSKKKSFLVCDRFKYF
jgi:hypothetical protein